MSKVAKFLLTSLFHEGNIEIGSHVAASDKLNVFFQLRGKDELFGTAIGTGIGDSFVHRALMYDAVASQAETFPTMAAFVLLLARVHRLVSSQVLLASE